MLLCGNLARGPVTTFAGVCFGVLGLAGCSMGPLADISSLSPAIQGDVVDNDLAFADASDQILLTNILRARDREPLNMGALASVSGALSLQGTAGFTIPFGPKPFSSSMAAKDSWAPSITGSTSPTYSFTPLNTQGFTLNVVQPVSASYVLNRWDAGLSRELLLLLFVKEIDFPVTIPANDSSQGQAVHYVRYINDPDNSDRFTAFMNLVHELLKYDANLKSFDVLDPVGPQFDLYAPTNATGIVAGGANTDQTIVSDMKLTAQPNQTGFGFITANNDGQYHVGNIISPATASSKAGTSATDSSLPATVQGQLYRVYAGQVALCVNAPKMTGDGYEIPVANPAPQSQATGSGPTSQIISNILERDSQFTGSVIATNAMANLTMSPPGSSPASPTTTGKGALGGASSSASAGASASQATTAALQAQRFSSMVDDDGCGPAEIVLTQSDEKDFEAKSENFVHIEWRSVSEIFDYLGAVLRYNDNPKNGDKPLSWPEAPASWVATNNESADDVKTASASDITADCGPSQTTDDCKIETLFSLSEGIKGHLRVGYGNSLYSVPDPGVSTTDQTMTVLSMLNTLVNLANTSSNVTTSTPLQLLPLP